MELVYRVATLPGNLEFEKCRKKPGIFTNFYMLSRIISFDTKNLYLDKNFCHHQIFFFNTFIVSLQYLFNVFILLNIFFNLKLNFKQKIDPKMRTYNIPGKILENLEEISKKGVATL